MAKKEKQSILDEVKENLKLGEDYWEDNYQRGVEDKEFVTVAGAQWEKGSIEKRRSEGKPSFEINLLRAYCNQQENTQRQNRPQAKVVPVDGGADLETAKLLEGLIKDTEEASDFESACDTAVSNAIFSGIGFIRIVTDYVSPDSFNQEPRFMPVHNPQAVYIDPQSKAYDGSDMNWAIVGEWIDKAQAIEQYGEDAISDVDMETYSDWNNDQDNLIRIIEYFKKEDTADTLVMLTDGTTGFKSKLLKEFNLSEDELKELIENERETTRTVIKWYKVSGNKVLEETEFPGKYIPIVPIYGGITFVEDERYIFSLIHFAKDSQRLYNYWKSTEAEILAKAQKYHDKMIASAGAVSGYEDQWRNPDKYEALFYNQVTENGEIQQPPYRMSPAQPPIAILGAAESSKQSITDILNMHSPIMGGDSQEVSGVAINLRQRQSETAQFNFQDNTNKGVRHCARILLGLYQELYTVPMMRRIIGVDGEAETVKLFDQTAEGLINDVTIGRYDVRMDTGPSFNTQREQNFQLIMQLLQMNPQLFSVIGDILLQNSPLMNAKEIAERIKKTMPPNLLSDGKDDGFNPDQAKAQIQQMDQVIQKMTADLEQAQKLIEDKDQDRQADVIKAQLQSETSVKVAKITAASRADVQELRGVVELLKQSIPPQAAPPNWIEQGEGVENYAPAETEQPPQPMEYEQPIEPAPDMNSPPSEGFLMPEENAQPENLAPNPDQIGESAMIENGGLPPMEQNNEF